MTTTSRPTKDGVAETAAELSANSIANLATLMQRSVERLAGLQKATLDTLGSQTADLNKTVRESFHANSDTPAKSFFDLADQSLQGWINAQKTIVDLITQQSAYVTDAAKERTMMTKPMEFITDLVKESAERGVDVQKTVLDYAAAQNKNISETVRKQAGVAGTPIGNATASVEKNVGAIIDAQKEALDAAAKLPRPVRA